MQSIKQVMQKFENQIPQSASSREITQDLLNYPAIKNFIEVNQEKISQEMIMNSLSKLNEYRMEKEALATGKEGQNPGFTPELFINYNYIDVTYVPTKSYLDMQAEKQTAALIDNRMMALDVQKANLEEYDLTSPQRLELMQAVTRFIEEVKEDLRLARGMYISGPFGVGKTYLLGALANALAGLGFKVSMIHYPTFTTEMKALIGQDNQLFMMLDRIKRVPILIIDDIGAESNSAWLRDDLLGVILEHRMKESLPTFFTSNFTMSELEVHLAASRNASDVTKAARIMERIKFLAKEWELSGTNRRLANR
ncbi:primosomal protein DnaI [Facklamia miroungae]|uniref:Primosomal protein DnaI n=1 Tax=Facklamia miroungae TaxID=120956 RepID=A0A1G7TLP5_9LACT|nr:primosomal protein DnaI [Facklamia miroungae]NKZ29782.1 primosomal protein DnaI [Facklamia miroungae]SDG36248.1 primosomal protein DnaI [Facklamia miroungae]